MSTIRLNDLVGFRGERIVELCLTDYSTFDAPLFRPGFLGDKWPAIDFYVELEGLRDRRFYFFIQTKSTKTALRSTAKALKISSKKRDIERLLKLPGPTYLLGVHEPTRRVFAKSVHSGTAAKAITQIELTHELTSVNLQKLYNEVRDYWQSAPHKPTDSVFR